MLDVTTDLDAGDLNHEHGRPQHMAGRVAPELHPTHLHLLQTTHNTRNGRVCDTSQHLQYFTIALS